MIASIRKFLLVNLLLAIIVMTILTALGNFYLDQSDIQRHLDTLLKQASFSIEALLGNDFKTRDLNQLQKNIDSIPDNITSSIYGFKDLPSIGQKYQFQVWSDKDQLLLHSLDAPSEKFTEQKHGFSDTLVANHYWRTYSKYNAHLGITILVAEQYDERERLTYAITLDDIYIMLITYPIAGFLIWFIIGRGLKSIDDVASEVSHRLPNYLEAVQTENIPIEIRPLVMELNKLFIRLQEALEREKRFAGDAAHELRTPLAALKTQTQVVLKTSDENERRDLLQNVLVGVDRCTHVVQQLLTMSRLVPEADVLSDAVPVNLTKVCSDTVAQLVPIALAKHIDIELLASEQEENILGNVTALGILVRNLVDNAIRYTPENGLIKVFISHSDSHVYLRVQDNGPGIPAELRARVFERFFRVLGNKSPGSGLGLAIVQQIANLHNATLKLDEPPVGTGLVIEVVFPKL